MIKPPLILSLTCLLGCSGTPRAPVATPRSAPESVAQTLVPARPSGVLDVHWAGDYLLVSDRFEATNRSTSRAICALDVRTGAVLAARTVLGAYGVAGTSVVTSQGVWSLPSDTLTALPLADVRQLAVSADGRWAARLSGRTTVSLMDIREATESLLYEGEHLSRVRFAGARVLVSTDRETLVLDRSGDIALRLPCGDVRAHGDPPRWICSRFESVSVLDWSTGEELQPLEVPEEIQWIELAEQQPDPDLIRALGHGRRQLSTLSWSIESGDRVEYGQATDVPALPRADAYWTVAVRGCGLTFTDEARDERSTTIVEDLGWGEELEPHASPCSAFEVQREGRLAAFSALGKVYVLDARSGATVATTLSSTLTACAGGGSASVEAMNRHGIVVPDRSGLAHACTPASALQRCATIPESALRRHCVDAEEALDRTESTVLGRSPNGRFKLIQGGLEDSDEVTVDEDSGEYAVALWDTAAATEDAVHVGTLRTWCSTSHDERDDGSWYAYDECDGGEGVVSDDGARVYALDGSVVLVIDVAAHQTTRLELPGYEASADSRAQLRFASASALTVSSDRQGWLVHLPSGRVRRSESAIVTSADNFAIVRGADAIDIVDLRTFEARRIEPVASSERWRLSADASTLVRVRPLRPMQRIDIARAERLESADPPAGYELDRDETALSPDGAWAYGCVDGRWRVVELGTGRQRTLARDCDGVPSWLDVGANERAIRGGGFLAIRDGVHATLHRMRDLARLDLEALRVGERLVWTAHADSVFWAPTDALAELMVRDAGDMRAARTPLARSPHFHSDLLNRFLERGLRARD